MTTSQNTPKVYTESGLQAACHTWFNHHFPAYRGLGFMIHNDGQKHGIAATQDKARGLVPGIPDWCLMVPKFTHAFATSHHGLFIEFKTGRNGLDPAQAKAIARLTAQGYRVEVVRDLPTFQLLLTEYLA